MALVNFRFLAALGANTDELIRLLVGSNWMPAALPLKFLCVTDTPSHAHAEKTTINDSRYQMTTEAQSHSAEDSASFASGGKHIRNQRQNGLEGACGGLGRLRKRQAC